MWYVTGKPPSVSSHCSAEACGWDLNGFHAVLELQPAVVGACGDLRRPTDISDGLAVAEQLLSGA
jgi:hypothetical protein